MNGSGLSYPLVRCTSPATPDILYYWILQEEDKNGCKTVRECVLRLKGRKSQRVSSVHFVEIVRGITRFEWRVAGYIYVHVVRKNWK